MMTVVRGLSGDDNNLPNLLKQLKNSCGAGGSIAEDAVEIQGSHLDRIREELQKIGYRVKG
jgi:translation initiation factor 1